MEQKLTGMLDGENLIFKRSINSMGYLRKNNIICDAAKKKNNIVFQNSFQETYQSGTRQENRLQRRQNARFFIHVGWDIVENEDLNGVNITAQLRDVFTGVTHTLKAGETYSFDRSGYIRRGWNQNSPIFDLNSVVSTNPNIILSYVGVANYHYNYAIDDIVGYNTVPIYSTRIAWNTKWRKLDA